MRDTDEATYREAKFRATGDEIEVREPDEIESDEEMFEVRMPIATTGEVRNDGDDPLTRDELAGMARQLQERQIGVFPAHGNDDKIAGSRYSPFERLGNWRAGEVQSRDSEDVLVATARMPDPESLPAATGAYREALAILKEQAKRGIGQDSSIGWRTDESFPGGNDLMEASIVGIGADWRTNTSDEAAEVVAREAVEAGANPETLVERVERAVKRTDNDMTDDTDPGEGTDTEGEQTADTDDGEPTERDFEDRMLEMQEEQTGLLRDLLERMSDDKDGDKDDDDDDDAEDDDGGEQDADPEGSDGDERDVDTDTDTDGNGSDVSERVADLEAELAEIREGGLSADDVETRDPDETQDADTDGDGEQRENDGGPENAGISISDLN